MISDDPKKYMRDYMSKRRGGRSYLNELEEIKKQMAQLEICLAWEAGELSEGTASKMLGVDRVTARGIRNDAIARGMGYADMSEMIQDQRKPKGV